MTKRLIARESLHILVKQVCQKKASLLLYFGYPNEAFLEITSLDC